MSKKEIKAGYIIKSFTAKDIIPEGAKFIASYRKPTIYSPHTGQIFKSEMIYEFLILK